MSKLNIPDPYSSEELRAAIDRLVSSEKTMRNVNAALRKGDIESLHSLGFDSEHIEQFKSRAAKGLPGFPNYTLNNIRRDIARLKKVLADKESDK